MRLGSLLALFCFAAAVCGQIVPPPGWPKDVPFPHGLKIYKPAQFGQYLVIRHDQPFHAWHDIKALDPSVNIPVRTNPNQLPPWNASGGLSGFKGWRSIKMTTVDPSQVKTWKQNLQVAGTSQLLPGWRWSFPNGTLFADLLVNDAGKPFELRIREKIDGKWASMIAFEDAAEAPRGYKGAGKCNSCHESAGSFQQYGLGIRGNDGVFSYSPFEN